jgi:hypothetical protein
VTLSEFVHDEPNWKFLYFERIKPSAIRRQLNQQTNSFLDYLFLESKETPELSLTTSTKLGLPSARSAKLVLVDEFLRLHQPSDKVRQRAERAGLDLNDLKATNPQHYKMLVAQHVLEVSTELEDVASSVIVATLRHHDVFRLEQSHHVTLLMFPELSDKELRKLDGALAQLAESTALKAKDTYFRVVTDKTGEHRQFALPISGEAWQGQLNILVGPFNNQALAQTWGEANVRPKQFIYDTLNHAGRWFCDVFSPD